MDVVGVEVEVVDCVKGLGVADGVPVEATEIGEVFGVVGAIWLAAGHLGLLLVDTICFDPLETERPLGREPSGVRDSVERMKSREGDALMQFPVGFLTLIAAVSDCLSLAARTRAKFTCGGRSATVVAVIFGVYIWC